MIPYDIDPTLHDSEPQPQKLQDGFSPPEEGPAVVAAAQDLLETALANKSDF